MSRVILFFRLSIGVFCLLAFVRVVQTYYTLHYAYTIPSSNIRAFDIIEAEVLESSGNKTILACEFPKLDPFNAEIMKLAGLEKLSFVCPWVPQLTTLVDHTLVVHRTASFSGLRHCHYFSIFRDPENEFDFIAGRNKTYFSSSTIIPQDKEFIQVECHDAGGKPIFTSYYAFIPRNKPLDAKLSRRLKKRQIATKPKETLNVIMVGLDGVSRNQYVRSMKKTYQYLINDLKSIDLTMYTQLGLNTFPNFLPLLTGQSYEEVTKWWNQSVQCDDLGFIWKQFERAGYRTLYSEDSPNIGAFHYLKKGFQDSPTHYCTRPLIVAIDKANSVSGNHHCVGTVPEINFHFNYVSQFLNTFTDAPTFSFTFFTRMTHDDMTNSGTFDDILYNFYTSLAQNGHLNRSLLISFSDHGPRWGAIRKTYQGTVESRTPLAIFSFPPWFLKKYPKLIRNFHVNKKRLTSHFDTHATLQDLLYFGSKKPPVMNPRHGISLFHKIPSSRTCKDIPIPPLYCLCGQLDTKQLNSKSELSTALSVSVLRDINAKRDPKLCEELALNRVLSVHEVAMPSAAAEEHHEVSSYRVRLQTHPGDAIYEAKATLYNKTGKIIVSRSIERLNMYRGQSECVQDSLQRPFCYCGNQS